MSEQQAGQMEWLRQAIEQAFASRDEAQTERDEKINAITTTLQEQIATLHEKLNSKTSSTTPAGSTTPPLLTPKLVETTTTPSHGLAKPTMQKPPKFDGTKAKYPAWKLQMQLKLRFDGGAISTTPQGLQAYILGSLEGDAATFAEHIAPRVLHGQITIDELWNALNERFEDRQRQQRAYQGWLRSKQSNRAFSDYFPEYEQLEVEAGMSAHDDIDRIRHLEQRLAKEIKTVLLAMDLPSRYQKYVSKIAEIDSKYRLLQAVSSRPRPSSPTHRAKSGPSGAQTQQVVTPKTVATPQSPSQPLESMDWVSTNAMTTTSGNRKPLLPKEHQKPSQAELRARKENNCCLNCGNQGHFGRNCPYARHSVRLNNVEAQQGLPQVILRAPIEEPQDSENE